jgi:hypothetical protein
VDTLVYAQSAHGRLECTGCHPGNWTYPHVEKNPPTPCGHCHEAEERDYALGLHGREAAAGNPDVPTCTRCHGVHDIASMAQLVAARPAMQNLLLNKCVECHTNPELMRKYGIPLDRFLTYETTAHGRADRFGSVAVARCATCHGSHAVLPPTDPRSPVNPQNLAATCGKCHDDAAQFVGRRYHVASEARPSLQAYTRMLSSFYALLLFFGAVATVLMVVVVLRKEE